jgi:hypothetical protein
MKLRPIVVRVLAAAFAAFVGIASLLLIGVGFELATRGQTTLSLDADMVKSILTTFVFPVSALMVTVDWVLQKLKRVALTNYAVTMGVIAATVLIAIVELDRSPDSPPSNFDSDPWAVVLEIASLALDGAMVGMVYWALARSAIHAPLRLDDVF